MHRVKIIVNPNADRGQAWRMAANLRPLVEEFGGADWGGTVYPGHAVELARQAGLAGYELVIAAGGDGTAHEVANGLMQVPAEQRPRLGIVPLGTGNDFANACGLPQQPIEALRRCLQGQPRRVDIGMLTDEHGRCEYWGNTVGIGFDATVTIRAQKFTLLHGFPVYLASVLQTIILNHHAPLFKVHTEQEEWQKPLIMLTLCNGPREGGGFLVAPQAQNNDGLFAYAGIGSVSRPEMLALLPQVMQGTHGKHPKVRMGTFKTMEIETDSPLTIHMDGEIFAGFGTHVRHLKIEMLPGALEVSV